MVGIERGQTRERGGDHPQFSLGEAEVVNGYIAGDMAVARQIARVVAARRFELLRGRRHVPEIPDLVQGAQGEPAGTDRDAHRLVIGAEVRVELAFVRADADHAMGLIRGDQQRAAALLDGLLEASRGSARIGRVVGGFAASGPGGRLDRRQQRLVVGDAGELADAAQLRARIGEQCRAIDPAPALGGERGDVGGDDLGLVGGQEHEVRVGEGVCQPGQRLPGAFATGDGHQRGRPAAAHGNAQRVHQRLGAGSRRGGQEDRSGSAGGRHRCAPG